MSHFQQSVMSAYMKYVIDTTADEEIEERFSRYRELLHDFIATDKIEAASQQTVQKEAKTCDAIRKQFATLTDKTSSRTRNRIYSLMRTTLKESSKILQSVVSSVRY